MSNNGSRNGGSFFNGFLWGAILGGGLVFLLGTKKGKQLLKVITERGLEGISEISDLIEDIEEEKEIREVPVKTIKSNGVHHSSIEHVSVHVPSESLVSKIKKPVRFFKGIPKRK